MSPRRNNMNPVASIILACTLGVLFALAIAHWMASCWDAGPAAMCTLAAPALPLPRGLRQLWLRWRMWLNDKHMAETERQISLYLRLLDDDRVHLLELRTRLARQQTRQLVLASEQ